MASTTQNACGVGLGTTWAQGAGSIPVVSTKNEELFSGMRLGSQNTGSNPVHSTSITIYLGLAQFGRAGALGASGRRFKSCIPDQNSMGV